MLKTGTDPVIHPGDTVLSSDDVAPHDETTYGRKGHMGMALSHIISSWMSEEPDDQEEPVDTEATLCGPPRPIERRERFTLRRLRDLMESDDRRGEQESVLRHERPSPQPR